MNSSNIPHPDWRWPSQCLESLRDILYRGPVPRLKSIQEAQRQESHAHLLPLKVVKDFMG